MTLAPLDYILIASTLLEFNPLFQAIKAVRRKSVQDISLFTFLSILTIGGLWFFYAITIHSVPLMIGNAIKLFTSLCVVIIYFKYRSPQSQ